MKSQNSKEFYDRLKQNAFFVVKEHESVNESEYREIVDTEEEFDQLPTTNEAGELEDAEKEGSVPTEPSNDPIDAPVDPNAPAEEPVAIEEPPVPEFDAGGEEVDPLAVGVEPPVEDVDSIQNEIIKMNTLTMKSVYDKLQDLNSTTDSLNQKVDILANDVEEVKEPTDGEKMLQRKQASYPYYFGLNDMWSDNWFEQERMKEDSKGIVELPDGSYIADFDNIADTSDTDINDSFNNF